MYLNNLTYRFNNLFPHFLKKCNITYLKNPATQSIDKDFSKGPFKTFGFKKSQILRLNS